MAQSRARLPPLPRLHVPAAPRDRRGVDVSLYDNPSLDYRQMYALRIGLQNGLDVRDLADPGMPWMDMLRTLEEIEEMLLREPVAKEVREKPVDLREVYESMPDDLKAYISGLLDAELGIDVDIDGAKAAITAKPEVGRTSRAPEIG